MLGMCSSLEVWAASVAQAALQRHAPHLAGCQPTSAVLTFACLLLTHAMQARHICWGWMIRMAPIPSASLAQPMAAQAGTAVARCCLPPPAAAGPQVQPGMLQAGAAYSRLQ